MSTPALVPLATITTTSIDGTIIFSSIPSGFKDLLLVSDHIANATGGISLRLNGDSSVTYRHQVLRADANGLMAAAENNNLLYGQWSGPVIGERNVLQVQIMDYSQTNKHKNVLTRSAYRHNDGALVERLSAIYPSYSQVTSITLFTANPSTSFAVGSVFSLYGIEG